MAKREQKWCQYCTYSGPVFALHSGKHLHCEHPDEIISGNKTTGWDTLRKLFDTCAAFERKK